MYKLFTFLMLALLLTACTTPPAQEPNVPENISERIAEENAPETPPPTWEDLYGKRLFANQSLIQKGVAVNLEGIFYNTTERRVYFVITGEDRHETLEARNPLNWHATYYFTKNEHLDLFLCDFNNTEKTWTTIYCEEEKTIPDNWYGQKTWVIYTLQEQNIISQRTSILEIIREENTFAFKTILPKP